MGLGYLPSACPAPPFNDVPCTHWAAAWIAEASSITATGPGAGWSSGDYVYDGTGNITKMGNTWFTYGKVNRLTAGNLYTAPLEREDLDGGIGETIEILTPAPGVPGTPRAS